MSKLNLLSPATKVNIQKNIQYIEAINGLIMIALTLVVFTFFVVAAQKYVAYRINILARIQNIRIENTQIEEINIKTAQVSGLQKDFIKWSQVLYDFMNIIPEGNVIYKITFDQNNKKLDLNGYAQNRDDFLQLQENLEKSDFILKVHSPISNLLYQENINFNLSADLNL